MQKLEITGHRFPGTRFLYTVLLQAGPERS